MPNIKIIDMMRADSPIKGHTAEWYFFRSYVGAALWSSIGDDDEPLDKEHDIDDLADETRERMLRDCASFYARNRWYIHCEDAPLSNEDINIAARQSAMAGHDFWLTRCGHGAGFWDGDWPEDEGEKLDNAAKAFGNVDLYVGEDGEIYAY